MRVSNFVGQIQRSGRQFNHVEFNPINPEIFVTSDDRGCILLFDWRNCFGSNWNDAALLGFTTRQVQNEKISPLVDIPSCSWSPDGKYLGAIFHNHFPTIYLANDPDPICVLESKRNGDQFYQSRLTMKSGSFSETSGRLQFVAGSEDFRAYGWDIPNLEEMLEMRTSNSPFKDTSKLSYIIF
jgi:WD40 repeat protein